MFNPIKWKDEILATELATEAAAGTGAKLAFALASAPFFVAKVTVAGSRVYDWIYNPATHVLTFDAAPANGAAILFYYYPEIQRGTAQSAANFNNGEDGILDVHMALSLFGIYQHHYAGQLSEEIKTVTLTNSAKFPFNNSAQTVNMTADKANTNYEVEVVEITAHDGVVGHVIVSEKLLNGFKLAFDGSATSATIKIKIKGGTM